MSIAMSLNAAALDRLIGGEDQISVELRQSIAEQFAEKHLKKLINDPGMGRIVEKTLAGVKTQVGEVIEAKLCELLSIDKRGVGSMWDPIKFVPQAQIKEAIKTRINEQVDIYVRKEIDAAVKAAVEDAYARVTARIQSAVDTAVRDDIGRRVREGVKAALGQVQNTVAEALKNPPVGT